MASVKASTVYFSGMIETFRPFFSAVLAVIGPMHAIVTPLRRSEISSLLNILIKLVTVEDEVKVIT